MHMVLVTYTNISLPTHVVSNMSGSIIWLNAIAPTFWKIPCHFSFKCSCSIQAWNKASIVFAGRQTQRALDFSLTPSELLKFQNRVLLVITFIFEPLSFLFEITICNIRLHASCIGFVLSIGKDNIEVSLYTGAFADTCFAFSRLPFINERSIGDC